MTISKRQADGVSIVFAVAIGVLTCLNPSVPVIGQSSEPAENLVANLSFEQAAPSSMVPAGWNGTPQVYSFDSGVARTGKASLKYVNRDPERYVLWTQKVPGSPAGNAASASG